MRLAGVGVVAGRAGCCWSECEPTTQTSRWGFLAGVEATTQTSRGEFLAGVEPTIDTTGRKNLRIPEKRVVESTLESSFFPATGTARLQSFTRPTNYYSRRKRETSLTLSPTLGSGTQKSNGLASLRSHAYGIPVTTTQLSKISIKNRSTR